MAADQIHVASSDLGQLWESVAKPVIGSLGALVASAVSYSVLFVFGLNKGKEESQSIQLINYRLDILDRLQKLGVDYIDHYRIVQLHAIERDVVRYIQSRTRDTSFERIAKASLWWRYALMPMPKGLLSGLATLVYYYVALLVVLLFGTIVAAPFLGIIGFIMEIFLLPIELLLVGVAALLRATAFRLRRRHEEQRFHIDMDKAPHTTAAAA